MSYATDFSEVNPQWIYQEDAAIKIKLQNLSVTDANAPSTGRNVPVRFKLPEDELAALSYPIIIIEHLPMSFAPERAHRGYVKIPYAPAGYDQWWDNADQEFDPSQSPYTGFFPIPVNMDYRVTVYTRKMAEHMQPLMARLATGPYLPFQMGYLNVPQDGTIRTMTLLGGPEMEYGKDQDNKRLFRCSYSVRVASEILPEVIVNGTFNSIVTQVNLNLANYSDVQDLTTENAKAYNALITTGPALSWNVA